MLQDYDIQNTAYQLNEYMAQFQHISMEFYLQGQSHLLSKGQLSQKLLEASKNVISQDSSPVFQFMFLFNKAISAYGSLVYESLSFEGLFNYIKDVLNKLLSLYEAKINTGYRSNMMLYDGKLDQFDLNLLDTLKKLHNFYYQITDFL